MFNAKKLQNMRKNVKSELKHIPRGNFSQNMLRAVYWSLRMNSLGKKAKGFKTKEDILKDSIKLVKKDYPKFVPEYDDNFFELKVKK